MAWMCSQSCKGLATMGSEYRISYLWRWHSQSHNTCSGSGLNVGLRTVSLCNHTSIISLLMGYPSFQRAPPRKDERSFQKLGPVGHAYCSSVTWVKSFQKMAPETWSVQAAQPGPALKDRTVLMSYRSFRIDSTNSQHNYPNDNSNNSTGMVVFNYQSTFVNIIQLRVIYWWSRSYYLTV